MLSQYLRAQLRMLLCALVGLIKLASQTQPIWWLRVARTFI